jgi:hypothetical protein
MTKGREATALEMIHKRDVLEFIVAHDSLGFRIRFKPTCLDSDSNGVHDVLGTLMSTEPCSSEHQSAAGAMGQTMLACMWSIGQKHVLDMVPSPHVMIGNWIKEPDMTMRPSDIVIGNGVLDDGFGFPFPTLVVEVAFAESRGQLLEDLAVWISPKSSVQVAIGIKIHAREAARADCKGTGDAEPIDAVDAVLYRRNFPTPEQEVRLHPTKPNAPAPALLVRLSDLFFGVAPGRLPSDLQQRVERGETVAVDLGYLVGRILKASKPASRVTRQAPSS